jgi:hypothetical protein
MKRRLNQICILIIRGFVPHDVTDANVTTLMFNEHQTTVQILEHVAATALHAA